MKVEYTKQFVKAAYKLSGNYKASLQKIVLEVKEANDISKLNDCIKMVGLQQSYRIRMGDYRLVLIIKVIDDSAIFQLLLSRGDVYKKEHESILRKIEKEE